MQMPPNLQKIMIAIGFLSRLPVPKSVWTDFDGRVATTAHLFPLAGLVIALPAAFTLWLLMALDADPLVAAVVALGVLTLTTGALHEDGLADCADGFGGGASRDRALEIMKDSRIGTYGAIALILSFGLRAATLSTLATELSPLAAAAIFAAIAPLSRAMMVTHWQALPSARANGTAVSAGQPDVFIGALALATGTVLSGILLIYALSFASLLLTLVAMAIAATLMSRRATSKIGGHTGDTIGATEQVCEMAGLLALSLLV